MTPGRICVFCASSRQCDPIYPDAGRRLGAALAGAGHTVVYGGGAVGVMGALADGALAAGGEVVGVIPRFMREQGWGHAGVSLEVVADMSERTRRMITGSDGFVALPGGSGTFEELFQAASWKRLGLHTRPIVVANLNRFFRPLLEQVETSIRERFMDPRHAAVWSVVESVDEVIPALRDAPAWDPNAIDFATL